MEPLRIDFHIMAGSPVYDATHIIHLDSLVAWAAYQEALERGDENPLLTLDDLPIKKLTKDGTDDFCWAASGLTYAAELKELRLWTRRFSPQRLEMKLEQGLVKSRATKMNLSSGPHKGFFEFEPLFHADKLSAWVIGDKAKLEKLLSRVKHIGKKTKRGYGKVAKLVIEQDDFAHKAIQYRAMPWKETEHHKQAICAFKPPYWRTGMGYYPTDDLRQMVNKELENK